MRRSLHWRQASEHAQSRKAKLARVEGTHYYDNKTMVLDALQRNGDVRLEVSGKRPTREVLHAFIKAKLAEDTDLIVADENNQYDGIADNNTRHETVSHKSKQMGAALFTQTA